MIVFLVLAGTTMISFSESLENVILYTTPMSWISWFVGWFLFLLGGGWANMLITFSISYFLTGVILGWLYGKIKSRKKLQALSQKP